jgi:hypothetical protein
VQRMQTVLRGQLIQFWIVRIVERVPGQSSPSLYLSYYFCKRRSAIRAAL